MLKTLCYWCVVEVRRRVDTIRVAKTRTEPSSRRLDISV